MEGSDSLVFSGGKAWNPPTRWREFRGKGGAGLVARGQSALARMESGIPNSGPAPEEIITIRGGKGDKDRFVPLAHSVVEPLREHLSKVRKIYEADRQAGVAGVWLAVPSRK